MIVVAQIQSCGCCVTFLRFTSVEEAEKAWNLVVGQHVEVTDSTGDVQSMDTRYEFYLSSEEEVQKEYNR